MIYDHAQDAIAKSGLTFQSQDDWNKVQEMMVEFHREMSSRENRGKECHARIKTILQTFGLDPQDILTDLMHYARAEQVEGECDLWNELNETAERNFAQESI